MSIIPKKLDAGKLPVVRGFIQRFPRAIYAVTKVSVVGTTKYEVPISDNSYAQVKDGYGRYTDAMGRHILDEAIQGAVNVEKGGALPPEGMELFHAAQAAWDAMARLEIMLIEQENYAKMQEPRVLTNPQWPETASATISITNA